MKKNLKILWTDLHSNLHHEDINKLPQWFEHAQQVLDFWPIAYYPYHMRILPSSMGVEDMYDVKDVKQDWEYLRTFVERVNQDGWPMFMGYEWQGSGQDGDHNVFFKENSADIAFPLRYQELYEIYKEINAIAIPHHLAYQEGNRGKNWNTHNEQFSPFVELYSSHGSSENDDGSIAMNRHVHMGPRVGTNSVEAGLAKGYQFGLIASGDNHSVPAVSQFGMMAVWAEDHSKDAIWEAMCNRHVYGVSEDRIQLQFMIDDFMMGDRTYFHNENRVMIDVHGCNALDYIELLGDNKRIKLIDCTTKQALPQIGVVRFQWKVEFGWGPDRRVFPEIASKEWNIEVFSNGKILRVLPCWNNFGQKQISQDEHHCEWELTTYKTTQSGKWMGSAAITTEAMILEMECDVGDDIHMVVDGKQYKFPVKQILKDSTLISLDAEVSKLIKDTYNEDKFYRNDTWWHNAYKFKVHKGALQKEYEQHYAFTMDLHDYQQVRVRVHQKNGHVAWSSPIFRKDDK